MKYDRIKELLEQQFVFNLIEVLKEVYCIYNGAAPTRGELKTSPGRFSGSEHSWIGILVEPTIRGYFSELVKCPNRPTKPTSGSIVEWVNAANNPEELKRLLLLVEPSSQSSSSLKKLQ